MIVLQANFDFDRAFADADQLLDEYSTLTGWSEALLAAGAARVVVLQRFHRHAIVTRNGVEYRFARGAHVAPPGLERFEIAHVNGLHFPGRTRLLRRLLPPRTPVVVQDHGGAPPANPLSRALRRSALGPVDGFLFTAKEQAAPWRDAGVLRARHRVYEVLEASTTFQPMDRAAAREASGVDGRPALLWVGRLDANKDPLTVLAGFERIVVPLPDASLTMVFGSDELLPAVRARLAESPALARRVRLVGYVPHRELPAFYSAADIFVLGSHREGSGYALLEACACGAVPVVTGIPAFRAITGDGAHGALWPAGDAVGLAHALLEVAGRDLAAARGHLARHFAESLSWPSVGRRALEVYAEARARRRKRG